MTFLDLLTYLTWAIVLLTVLCILKKEGAMDGLVYRAWCWLGEHGYKSGLILILLVSAWDFLCFGFRGFFEYAIGWKGVCLIWVGVWLIFHARRIEKGQW